MSTKTLSKLDSPKNIRDSEKKLGDNDFIVSKTDTKGKITYCNEIFTKMAGYPASSLIGANHNLIRHPDMPRIAFKVAWDLIQSKQEFFGFVKNLCADGGYYWVFTYITADLDSRGNIISYTSVRRKPPRSAIDAIAPIYKLLLDAENKGGSDASGKILANFLAEKKTSYDEFVINLQKDIRTGN
ncbi:PAS domain-containing protein [Candidatus Sulfurimonas baltica]|uniref:PAS domain-containing protein n=1 Tax=Candidatus Sulfurimonas baltica TaxID=2740404 RepID=A0A7S7RNB3_9BACT|nr:PAS domain-containing protein [Candidatus Sulfurimonas baltica]